MILKERFETIPSEYYAWHCNDEYWQETHYLTEEELQSDDSNWNFILVELLLSDSRGQYIPRDFYINFDLEKWHIKAEEYLDLSNPDNELYWCAWEELTNNAYCIHNDKKYTLYQNGDLYAIHYMED